MHSGSAYDRGLDLQTRLREVVGYFESMSMASLAQLGSIYTPDAQFKDPFNDVRGLPAVTAIYAHMFTTLESPRFVIRQAVLQGSEAFLIWDFSFSRRGGSAAAMSLHGATHLSFDADGRIARHRDYWDTGEELYAKLPLIGAVVRWLARRLRVRV